VKSKVGQLPGSYSLGVGTWSCPTLDFTVCLFYTGLKIYQLINHIYAAQSIS
jgi:hypothetical protein